MLRALAWCGVLCCITAGAHSQTVRHKYSFDGVEPTGWTKLEETNDNDGDAYVAYSSPGEQPLKVLRVIYRNPAKWWKDQQYILGYTSTDGFFRQPAINYPNDSVYEWAEKFEAWNQPTKNFVSVSPSNPTWILGRSWGQSDLTFIGWNQVGEGGAFHVGFTYSRPGENPPTQGGSFLCFWPAPSGVTKAEGKINPFNTNSGNEDGSGGGDEGGSGDPNAEGWGTFLSLDWWKKLMIFLFVPSEGDLQVVKDGFSQFMNWGPFALVADVASGLGTIAGQAPSEDIENMVIHMPTLYAGPDASVPIQADYDLRPWAPYILMIRAFVLGVFMLRAAKFWGKKYAAIGSKS